MIVFICGRTGRRVKYGKDDGLVFTVPREGKATAIVKGVQIASAFWGDYGAVMKMSGALLCTLVKASTSLDLREILPLDYLSDMAAGAMGALGAVSSTARTTVSSSPYRGRARPWLLSKESRRPRRFGTTTAPS